MIRCQSAQGTVMGEIYDIAKELRKSEIMGLTIRRKQVYEVGFERRFIPGTY